MPGRMNSAPAFPENIMAIEKADAMVSEAEEVFPDGESEMEMEGEELSDTLLGGMDVSEGDVVRIVVVRAPDGSGTWMGKYASNKPKSSAIDEMSEEITATGEEI